jgi:hypothetical protein
MGLKDFLTFQNYFFQYSNTPILQHSSLNYCDHIQDFESSNYDRLKYIIESRSDCI